MMNKSKSTFDQFMENPEQKALFEKEYREFLLDELMLSLLEDDEKSVRKLAVETGVSPRIIQALKSGKQHDMKLSNFYNMAAALGYHIILQKGRHKLDLDTFKLGSLKEKKRLPA